MGKLTIIVAVTFSLFLFPLVSLAGRTGCPEEGFVPCGTKGCPCQLCDFFVMFDRIADFFLKIIVPPVAVLLLIVSGIMFFFTGGNPTSVGGAKKILTATIVGLAIIYGSFLIISTFMTVLGVAQWTGLGEWFRYPCP